MPIDSGYGLLGSPILFDIHTLVVQRQIINRSLPWPSEIFITSQYFISRLYILGSCWYLLVLRSFREHRSTLQFLLKMLKPSSYTLRLVKASNAPPSTYYRSCWHVVSPGFSSNPFILGIWRTNFTTALAFTTFSAFHLRNALVQASAYWPIFPTAADGRVFFIPCVTGRSFNPATSFRLCFVK